MTTVLSDGVEALRLVFRQSWRRLVVSWLYVPAGIMVILAICFGIHSLIGLSTVSFPASVACMILLFFFLIGCELVLGDRKTKAIVRVIDVPAGFTLRYINIFFCPSFILLPLSPAVSGVNVAKIIAVFIIGFAIMFPFTAYLVRGMQLLFGSSKRAATERAEEMGREDDQIPLTTNPARAPPQPESPAAEPPTPPSPPAKPSRAQDPAAITGLAKLTLFTASEPPAPPQRTLPQAAPRLTRAQSWASFATAHLDALIYTLALVLAGLPVYYATATAYAMPAQLCISVLAYFSALALPAPWRRFLHPVLVASAASVLAIWLLALSRGRSLRDGLSAYSTHTRYTQLWQRGAGLSPPGAGDIFGSVLDASIVALALPMFQYRHELKRHFPSIVLPTLALSIASLLLYPLACAHLSLPAPLSLSFASRSLTLALAIPATANLGGDANLVAVLCITSGILAVLVGPAALRALRVPEDDYVTRGVTLGCNGSAIATALLLGSDPRAAALSSLSMGLFGTVVVGATSVPAVVGVVRGLVGL